MFDVKIGENSITPESMNYVTIWAKKGIGVNTTTASLSSKWNGPYTTPKKRLTWLIKQLCSTRNKLAAGRIKFWKKVIAWEPIFMVVEFRIFMLHISRKFLWSKTLLELPLNGDSWKLYIKAKKNLIFKPNFAWMSKEDNGKSKDNPEKTEKSSELKIW